MVQIDDAGRARDQVLDVLGRHLKYAPPDQDIPLDADLKELGLDSMGAIDLLLDLEQSLRIVFPDELLTEETFRNAANLIEAIGSLESRTRC